LKRGYKTHFQISLAWKAGPKITFYRFPEMGFELGLEIAMFQARTNKFTHRIVLQLLPSELQSVFAFEQKFLQDLDLRIPRLIRISFRIVQRLLSFLDVGEKQSHFLVLDWHSPVPPSDFRQSRRLLFASLGNQILKTTTERQFITDAQFGFQPLFHVHRCQP
jgi:hypothetical protein